MHPSSGSVEPTRVLFPTARGGRSLTSVGRWTRRVFPESLAIWSTNETNATGHVIVYGERHTSFFSADFLLVSYVVAASRSIPLRLSLFHATNFF